MSQKSKINRARRDAKQEKKGKSIFYIVIGLCFLMGLLMIISTFF